MATWKKFLEGWDAIGRVWLAKDLAVWIWGPTVVAAVGLPLLYGAFRPLSGADMLLMAVVFGVLAFFVAARFAPRPVLIAHPSPVQLSDAELKVNASKWLIHKLSGRALGVVTVELFGSIVHDHYQTSDVDVIVCLKPMRAARIASAVREIRGSIATDFDRTFGHKLHVQFFCAGEDERHAEFKIQAGKHELLIGA